MSYIVNEVFIYFFYNLTQLDKAIITYSVSNSIAGAC